MLFETWWTKEREEVFRMNYKIDQSLAIEILARDAFVAGMFKDAKQPSGKCVGEKKGNQCPQ